MEFGILSIIPPVIAIVLALVTKEVISSLLLGILAGALIFTGGNVIGAFETLFTLLETKMAENAGMLLFLGLLGVVVVLVTKAGGSLAYGEWASKKIKTKAGAQIATSILGVLIFIDDYFNCLTIGTVMRPITDKYNVSRAKLAYMIDSTAAPVCILMPVSSWGASVVATIGDVGIDNAMNVFLKSIPFNFYAIFAIFGVFYFAATDHDFGPMRRFEQHDTSALEGVEEKVDVEVSTDGSVMDLILPVVVLIVVTVVTMLYTGGYFSGEGLTLFDAFGDAGVTMSLVFGAIAAIVCCLIMYLPRKLMSFTAFMESFNEGVKSMVPAMIILILAWTIGGICRDGYLDTGSYVGHLIETSSFPLWLLPMIVFVAGALLAFSTGTAWGTFGILIPIVVPIIDKIGALEMLPLILGAIFSGSVFGDHCSPISDTTILSSAGASCRHIDHVQTQIPYAVAIAIFAALGFLVGGFTNNVIISLAVTIVAVLGYFTIMWKRNAAREAKQ